MRTLNRLVLTHNLTCMLHAWCCKIAANSVVLTTKCCGNLDAPLLNTIEPVAEQQVSAALLQARGWRHMPLSECMHGNGALPRQA